MHLHWHVLWLALLSAPLTHTELRTRLLQHRKVSAGARTEWGLGVGEQRHRNYLQHTHQHNEHTSRRLHGSNTLGYFPTCITQLHHVSEEGPGEGGEEGGEGRTFSVNRFCALTADCCARSTISVK